MAAEGKNKVATSLLDLQPTAILELFKVYPDRINKPSLFVGFHGGSIFSKAMKWQGIQYIPLAIESEGFDILGDGKLPRPKIRVANHNSIITNLLQNYKDFKNAKVIRKKVQVKFLDDDNFDGGNPFGVADSKAELLDEEWIMGRKTQESKIFVEFELNSPLDLENFTVNSRGVQARFCCWQYRGEGCRYQGLPIEQEDGSPFLTTGNETVKPVYNTPTNPDGVAAFSSFFNDESIIWNGATAYAEGDIVIVESPTILLPTYGGGDANEEGVPLKTVYVSVAVENSGNHPEKNPSFWQKDGCTKKLTACQKRFNKNPNIIHREAGATHNFLTVKLSGAAADASSANYTRNSGVFHTTESDVTGTLDPRKEWTVVGWANINSLSPRGAGLFSTSQADSDTFPAGRFVNINTNSKWNGGQINNNIQAQYIGHDIHKTSRSSDDNKWRTQFLSKRQSNAGDNEEWHQYVIRHRTGTANFINGEGDDQTTVIEFFVDGASSIGARGGRQGGNDSRDGDRLQDNIGNFASWSKRTGVEWDGGTGMLPQTFMIGGVEFFKGRSVFPNYDDGDPPHVSSINGYIGMWGLWNRALKEEEIIFLRKEIVPPWQATTNKFTNAPRLYSECVGIMSTLTGGTGWSDPAIAGAVPTGTAPFLYGKDSLVAWWDGTTGNTAIGNGLLDIHTGVNTTLTGSGQFSGVDKSYVESTITTTANPTPPNPRFGGFPGTDGFSYGRTF